MKSSGGPVTVGVDVGTTSVKALAVDENGQVVARSRVAHSVVAPEPDILRHDAKRAWRSGPRKAFEQVTAAAPGGGELAGRRGGGLHGPVAHRRQQAGCAGTSRPPLRGPRGPGRQRRTTTPSCRWERCPTPRVSSAGPPQRCPTPAATGPARPWRPMPSRVLPAIDTGVTASLGMLHTHGRWNAEMLGSMGVAERQMPTVAPDGPGGRHAAGERRHLHGRDHRRPLRPDRVGRRPPGRRPGDLRGHAHLLGGLRRMADRRRADQLPQHDAGALPRRRPEQCRRPLRRLGPPSAAGHAAARARARAARATARDSPIGFRSGCPMCAGSARPSRITRCARTSTGSISDRARRRSSGPPTRRAGSWCAGWSSAPASSPPASWPAEAARG